MDYRIGKVVGVRGGEIYVSLLDHDDSGNDEFGVPDDMTIHLPSNKGPIPTLIGQPGTFVGVALPSGLLLCLVTEIDMREGKFSLADRKDSSADGMVLIDRAQRALAAVPVGTIDSAGNFERGTDVLPTVNAPAFAVSPTLMSQVYASYSQGDFAIGKLSLLPAQKAKIHLDSFLTRHAAVLGQTGGGKSWTVASLIQKMCLFEQATIVLFDLHGEYADTFSNSGNVISASDLELPYWLMNSEELLSLMVDRSETAAPNQIAKFKELLQDAKNQHEENQQLGLKKITIDTPVFFDFAKILNQFRTLDVQTVTGATGKPKQGPYYGQFTRLLMRIDSRLNDSRYDMIFRPSRYNSSASMESLFRKILGEEIKERSKVTVIDLSPVPFDVRSSIISLILRCIFEFAYWHRRVHGKRFPISVFADEAHIYLNDQNATTAAAKEAAERIAKEGRKEVRRQFNCYQSKTARVLFYYFVPMW
ncbi:MAG: ATP-binding protein [Pseudomonadota bacterium]